jgi:DNA-binding CsgD family transcriptional regulator/tetratricopeptide (TPR) repeat protein
VAGPVAFVGRERELSRLLGALSRHARMVLVVGDAGVGKTRFAAEGMARAAAAGVVMVRGECLPLVGVLPLLPVAQALGELAGLDRGRVLEEALAAAAPYVREQMGRLLPRLGPGGWEGSADRDEGWQRERLFSAVADLLGTVAGRSGAGLGLVIEDVHWADTATLDCLTFLARAGRGEKVSVLVTCRGDEAPLAAQVAGWMAEARGAAGVEEIRLGPLSRAEVAEQVAALAGGPAPPPVAEELYARAEGNPFFTEQLVAAGLADGAGGGLRVPAELPARLAELLVARAGRCAGEARAVLAALAVAGRPLGEDRLAAVSGLVVEAVRRGLRDLAAARLLAEGPATVEGHRPRHALLAEAVAGGLLPVERQQLHERAARALTAAGDDMLAAEIAGHWQAASRPVEELPERVAAAAAAERVFGYAEAAAHWRRAIELCQTLPDAASAAGIEPPVLHLRAIDALLLSGDDMAAGVVAEDAYRRFADYPDPATAAVICARAAYFRGIEASPGRRAAGLPLIQRALRLFEQAPPSADHAEAWLDYAQIFLLYGQGRTEACRTALARALEIADAAGAAAVIARIMPVRAVTAFYRGQVDEGFDILRRGQTLALAAGDARAPLELAIAESHALLTLGKFQRATEVALRGLQTAHQTGLENWLDAPRLASNAAAGLLARGQTAEAAALIDPLVSAPPDPQNWAMHQCRAEIDLLHGDIGAATSRRRQVEAIIGHTGHIDIAREDAQQAAELAVWAGRPAEALEAARRVLPLFLTPDLTILCGRLLAAGMRASADLAERAHARRDDPAAMAAVTAADGLASWAEQMAGAPFTGHPYVASIPAERATWDAERTRVAGESDPATWGKAAQAWRSLGCPHRAGYALWRQSEAQLNSGQPAAAAAAPLRAAAAEAAGHAPLLAQVRALAARARIPLQDPDAAATPGAPAPPRAPAPFGLTGRELAVLRLLAAGQTNAQIGAELFISPRTAGVHVTNILRKLGVSGRVQAAAVAERAGLLDNQRP